MKLNLPTTEAELWHRLREPFKPSRVKWRMDQASHRTKKVMLLCYIDARTVAMRLDEVCGPTGWSVRYEPWEGGVLCTLTIYTARGPIEKQGVGTAGNFEQVKGAASDAFKRAAVQWGIGRYLYSVPSPWVPVQDKGHISVYHKDKQGDILKGYATPPALPKWATPEGWPALEQDA
jgi:hypothetical protein